jgi:hypothetical protein
MLLEAGFGRGAVQPDGRPTFFVPLGILCASGSYAAPAVKLNPSFRPGLGPLLRAGRSHGENELGHACRKVAHGLLLLGGHGRVGGEIDSVTVGLREMLLEAGFSRSAVQPDGRPAFFVPLDFICASQRSPK